MKAKNQRLDPARARGRRGARRGLARHVGAAATRRPISTRPRDIARQGLPLGPGGADRRHGPERLAQAPAGRRDDRLPRRRRDAGDHPGRAIAASSRTCSARERRGRRRPVPARRPVRRRPRSSPSMTSITCRRSSTRRGMHKTEQRRDDRRSRPCRALAGGGLSLLQLVLGAAALRPGGEALLARGRPAGRGRAGRCWSALAFALPDLAVPAHRSVGEAGRREQPFAEALALQIRRHLGESRRLDAAVGDDARASPARRSPCSSGACASGTLIATLAAQAAIGLGFYAFLLFASNPFARLDPGAGRGQRAQSAAPGPRPGLPSADPLFRLCRHLDRLLLRGRRARHARRRPGLRPGDAALGARRLDLPDPRHHRRQLLGLLRAWLGRLVVLGSGRECLADALAGGDRPAPFGDRAGDPRRACAPGR